jgi:hypothetical protein
VDYPSQEELREIVKTTTARGFEEPQPVLTGQDVLAMRDYLRCRRRRG